MFLFHGLLFYLLAKIIKHRGHQTNFLTGEKNVPQSPRILKINQYETLWSVLFTIYINSYYLSEVIQHYKAEKGRKKQCIIGAHPGIDPGALVPKLLSKCMIRKYYNRKLQTNPWYREEEQQDIYSKKTSERK